MPLLMDFLPTCLLGFCMALAICFWLSNTQLLMPDWEESGVGEEETTMEAVAWA